MATKKWTWKIEFTLDADAGGVARVTGKLEGHDYEVNIAPVARMEGCRRPPGRLLKDSMDKEAVSTGPRGGGCPCCGK